MGACSGFLYHCCIDVEFCAIDTNVISHSDKIIPLSQKCLTLFVSPKAFSPYQAYGRFVSVHLRFVSVTRAHLTRDAQPARQGCWRRHASYSLRPSGKCDRAGRICQLAQCRSRFGQVLCMALSKQEGTASYISAFAIRVCSYYFGDAFNLSLTQDPLTLGPDECLFQGDHVRPGDLVWVLVDPESTLTETLPITQTRGQCTSASAGSEQLASHQGLSPTSCSPAFQAACAVIREAGTNARPAAICRAIVQSSFSDCGFVLADLPDDPRQLALDALSDTAGVCTLPLLV